MYLVTGGYQDMGEDTTSSRVFSTLEKAYVYHDAIADSFDYVDLRELTLDDVGMTWTTT
jgi:hypothetical protein